MRLSHCRSWDIVPEALRARLALNAPYHPLCVEPVSAGDAPSVERAGPPPAVPGLASTSPRAVADQSGCADTSTSLGATMLRLLLLLLATPVALALLMLAVGAE